MSVPRRWAQSATIVCNFAAISTLLVLAKSVFVTVAWKRSRTDKDRSISRSQMNEKVATPDLNDVLTPLLASYGLVRNRNFQEHSGRLVKNKIRMKSWAMAGADISEDFRAVFVYSDNTVGLRSTKSNLVELDLVASDPEFCIRLEAWLEAKIKLNKEKNDDPIQAS
jgi:hypothetical protein